MEEYLIKLILVDTAVALDSLKKLWVGSADPDWESTVSSYYKR